MLCAEPSTSAGGRGQETSREWSRPGLVARQMMLSKPKTLRVGVNTGVTLSYSDRYLRNENCPDCYLKVMLCCC